MKKSEIFLIIIVGIISAVTYISLTGKISNNILCLSIFVFGFGVSIISKLISKYHN